MDAGSVFFESALLVMLPPPFFFLSSFFFLACVLGRGEPVRGCIAQRERERKRGEETTHSLMFIFLFFLLFRFSPEEDGCVTVEYRKDESGHTKRTESGL